MTSTPPPVENYDCYIDLLMIDILPPIPPSLDFSRLYRPSSLDVRRLQPPPAHSSTFTSAANSP